MLVNAVQDRSDEAGELIVSLMCTAFDLGLRPDTLLAATLEDVRFEPLAQRVAPSDTNPTGVQLKTVWKLRSDKIVANAGRSTNVFYRDNANECTNHALLHYFELRGLRAAGSWHEALRYAK